MQHYISVNRKEFRKSGKLGIVCTCGFSEFTENNKTGELVALATKHRHETGHILAHHYREFTIAKNGSITAE